MNVRSLYILAPAVLAFFLRSSLIFSLSPQRDSLPVELPPADASGVIKVKNSNQQIRTLNINSALNDGLERFIKNNGNHIAAAVVIDANTGEILALAQGRHPYEWGSLSHSALFSGFPAASLFKTVSTTALIDLMDTNPDEELPFWGGCGKVQANGIWLKEDYNRKNVMSLKKAFATSCNGFFAKIAIKDLGIGVINNYADRFGWGHTLPTDFYMNKSLIHSPDPGASSIQTIGKYSAGFGAVGMSAVHAAWIYTAIANDGTPLPLRVFADSKNNLPSTPGEAIFKPGTGEKMRLLMNKTIRGGTASSAFRRRGYAHLIPYVGGKTGTLNGHSPEGLTTWFAGMMPIQKPKIVVAAVVVTGDRWVIKGPHLAAEAFRLWFDLQRHKEKTPLISKNN